ncbi:MarR family winged helix-turn-helix transcriptional regulator [Massilia sp. MS-15]|uniref:MarR family winged helix-turn-helix transcriptional regulator n=1 Tax=Massilia sp. MS-15 TaxID=2878200 RepID=UPI001CD2EFD3|nr:MarR family winged helix-turn-helix transcriptional regulator [Massilia sp. MS-15]MCA1246380.1 MarR family winged helix-turn-helix transcriptional regulator [Massilia sp. MS-15]
MTDQNDLPTDAGTPLDSPTSEFCLRMARAWAALSRRLDSSLGSLHGISFVDYQLLLSLQRAPGGRLRRVDLAEALGLTASGVTRSLLPLEKIGLVDRQSDPRDARVGYAIITPTGSELVTNASVVVHNVSRMLLGAPSRAQIEASSALLAQLGSSK